MLKRVGILRCAFLGGILKNYHTYSEYLVHKYGEKIYKLSINLPITCPNRLNGHTGCIFCADIGTGFESNPNTLSIQDQMLATRKHVESKYHAHKFIAYFQNYTNTFMPLSSFKQYLRQAAAVEDIVEIDISTRPDCISKDYLDALKEISIKTGVNISIELGVQSVNYHTLDAIDRGHGLGAIIKSILLIHSYGFPITTHVILNLPGDTIRDIEEMVEVLNALPIQIVKVHSLYIAKHSKLCSLAEHGKIKVGTEEEYMERLVYFVTHIHPDYVIERLFSRIPKDASEFSNWGQDWRKLQSKFDGYMDWHKLKQGCYYSDSASRGLTLLEE